uniref:Rab-GAP TBC domain-containing protein n=1 Tax=Aureoumbra lagunensis TaxID=44058 RepID=A0A7S3NKD8_9STRA
MEIALMAKREEYAALRKEHLPDVATVAQSDDGDPLSNMLFSDDASSGNLSHSGGSSGAKRKSKWDKYHESVDLREEIRKDLERLTVAGFEDDHFHPVIESMLNVLAVWASARGGSTGYRQGMHEVLVLVIIVIQDEAFYGGGLEPSIEADAFALFDAIMVQHKPMFAITDDTEDDAGNTNLKKNQKQKSPILALLRRAQSTLLAKIDPSFAHVVSSLEAQLYGLRWIRLLFLREFKRSPAEPLALCDGIFAMVADGKVSHFLDALEAAFIGLILANKRRILAELNEGGDKQMACLAILMRPQDVAASHVISLANGPILRALHSRSSQLSPTESGYYSQDEKETKQNTPDHLMAGDPLQTTMPLFTESSSLPTSMPPQSSHFDPLLNPVTSQYNNHPPLTTLQATDPLTPLLPPSAQPPPTSNVRSSSVTHPPPNMRPLSLENTSPEKLATTLNSALLVLDNAVPYTNLSARRAIEEIADVAATLQKLQHSSPSRGTSATAGEETTLQQHQFHQVAV